MYASSRMIEGDEQMTGGDPASPAMLDPQRASQSQRGQAADVRSTLQAESGGTQSQGTTTAGTEGAGETGDTAAAFVDAYATRLETALTDAQSLAPTAQATSIEGTLGQVEAVSALLEAGQVPDIENLPAASTTDLGTYVPPALIQPVRALIDALEAAGPGEDGGPETAASGTDWNSRLGVPQYRTQSDNLASPEGTCNVTALAMIFERLGYNRADVLAAIERRDAEWQTKVAAYLRNENSSSRKAYQTLRGNRTDSAAAAEGYADNAQMEDLLDYLLTGDMGHSRTTVRSQAGNIINAVETNADARPTTRTIDRGAMTWAEVRDELATTLDGGGGAMLSLYHKGKNSSGSHLVSIQALQSDGLILDDPYGGIRSTYNRNNAGDAYADPGSTRGGSNYRNVVDRSGDGDDWHVENTRELTDNESRGDSSTVTDTQLESMWKSVLLFNRPDPTPADAEAAPAGDG